MYNAKQSQRATVTRYGTVYLNIWFHIIRKRRGGKGRGHGKMLHLSGLGRARAIYLDGFVTGSISCQEL